MLENTGYTPDHWVEIVDRGLTKEEACALERLYIKKYKPEYNKIQGASLLKVTPEILEEANTLRNAGWSYQKIADNFDLATMTIHRAMNGKSPALEEIIERQP
jgi:DNA invertase Pin-like site-specific DNA recombinase